MEVPPSLNRQKEYTHTMGSSSYHSIFEQDNISTISRRVENILASQDEYAMLVASPFEPFCSGVLF
jgi:hypothetical protein